MADGGRVLLAFIEESTWGTTPASALKKIAFATAESLSGDTSTVVSNAIRGDYIKPQVIRTDAQGGGGFDFELAYKDVDDFWEGAFRNDWGAAKTTGAFTPTADDAANKYTRAAGSFLTDGFAVGHSVLVSGFGIAANNGYAVITAVDATNMTVSGLDLAAEVGSGDEVIAHDGVLIQATTPKSYTVEREFDDLTNKFIPHTGMRVSSVSLSAQAGAILTGSVAFVGKMPGVVAAATAGSGAYSASTGANNSIMNGIDNVTGIFLANDDTLFTAAVTYNVSQIDLTFNSPARPIQALGTLGPVAIGSNSFEWSGSIRVYTDDTSIALFTDYVNYTEKALWFRYVDTAGNAYLFYLPQVQITASDGPNSSGPDSDVMQAMNFTCEYDSDSAALAVITRIDA